MGIDPAVWNQTADGIDQIVKDIDAGTQEASPRYRDFLVNVAKGLRGETQAEP